MKRRALLASLGAATATTTAGCLSSIEDHLDTTVRLGWLGAHNFDTEPHAFDLRVERNGETVHESSHEVEEREDPVVHGAVADCTWGDAPGDYTVRARVDGGEWAARELSEIDEAYEGDVDCVVSKVEYREGRVEILIRGGCDRVDSYDGGCAFANQGETENESS